MVPACMCDMPLVSPLGAALHLYASYGLTLVFSNFPYPYDMSLQLWALNIRACLVYSSMHSLILLKLCVCDAPTTWHEPFDGEPHEY